MEQREKRAEFLKGMVRIVTIQPTSVKERCDQIEILSVDLAILSGNVPSSRYQKEEGMQEKRRVLYKKGVFVCPGCRQSYVQEKWIEEWRIRCHRCTYRGTLTEVSVEEHMEEETFRR